MFKHIFSCSYYCCNGRKGCSKRIRYTAVSIKFVPIFRSLNNIEKKQETKMQNKNITQAFYLSYKIFSYIESVFQWSNVV